MMTKSLRKEDVDQHWLVVDAKGQVLGRLATQVATLLRGKHKPDFTPHVDNGDFVIVINASGIRVTGNKSQNKTYFRHTGFPGGKRFSRYEDLVVDRPEEVIRKAVHGMLPKNRLGRKIIKKLKVYAGPEHQHEAQEPIPYEIPYPSRTEERTD